MSTSYNISSSTHINHNPTTFNHPLSTKLSSTNYKVIECFLIFRELINTMPLEFLSDADDVAIKVNAEYET